MTQTGCSSGSTDVACRTMKIKTNTPGSFVGSFTVEALGGNTITQPITLKVNRLDCSSTMPIIVPNPL